MYREDSHEELIVIGKDWKSRALIRAQLMEEGYEVRGVLTLGDAFMVLRSKVLKPLLIIFDTFSHHLDERALKELNELAGDAPIIICTSPYQMTQLDFRGLGFQHVIVRPFMVRDVLGVVRSVLGISR